MPFLLLLLATFSTASATANSNLADIAENCRQEFLREVQEIDAIWPNHLSTPGTGTAQISGQADVKACARDLRIAAGRITEYIRNVTEHDSQKFKIPDSSSFTCQERKAFATHLAQMVKESENQTLQIARVSTFSWATASDRRPSVSENVSEELRKKVQSDVRVLDPANFVEELHLKVVRGAISGCSNRESKVSPISGAEPRRNFRGALFDLQVIYTSGSFQAALNPRKRRPGFERCLMQNAVRQANIRTETLRGILRTMEARNQGVGCANDQR